LQACCRTTHFLPLESDPSFQPDRAQCCSFNTQLMRNLIDQKMRKNKSFLEMKLMPDAPICKKERTPSPMVEEEGGIEAPS